MPEKTMEIVIVGGSLSGILHAIVFKHLGHKVHVLESSPQAVLHSQAAGLSLGPEVQKFIDEYIKIDKPYTKTANNLHVVDAHGEAINTLPSGRTMHTTTWSQLYNLLNTHLLDEGAAPLVTYETDKLVQDVKYDGEKIAVVYSDTNTETSNTLQADLVIAADGGHSSVRQTVIPGLSPKYAGYITWRGAVPESSVSEASRKILQDRILYFRYEEGYILSYHVPSETGSVEPGDCQCIWVWYQKLDEDSEDFGEIFTDVLGKKHFTTIPRGKIQPKVWDKIRNRSAALSAPFAELVEKTSDPFVSAIRDCVAPQAVFHDGKLLLVGDAFALFRPHVALSTNQAAMQALGLAEVSQGKRDLADWEKASLEYARRTNAISISFGGYLFTGEVPSRLRHVIRPDNQSQ